MSVHVHCECGAVLNGENDDEIVAAVENHVKEAHPEMAGQFTREQILEMAHGAH